MIVTHDFTGLSVKLTSTHSVCHTYTAPHPTSQSFKYLCRLRTLHVKSKCYSIDVVWELGVAWIISSLDR